MSNPPPESRRGKVRVKKKPSEEEENEPTWTEGAKGRRIDMRLGKLEHGTEENRKLLTTLLGRVQERQPAAPTMEGISFESPEGQAAFESAIQGEATARTNLFAKDTAYRSLNILTGSVFEAEDDVVADLHLIHASMLGRESKLQNILKKHGQGTKLTWLIKLAPWITILVLGALVLYGIFEPGNFQQITAGIESDFRVELAIIVSIIIIVVSGIYLTLRERRRGKPTGQGV